MQAKSNLKIAENQERILLLNLDQEFVRKCLFECGILDVDTRYSQRKLIDAFFQLALILNNSEDVITKDKEFILLSLRSYYNLYGFCQERDLTNLTDKEIVQAIIDSNLFDNAINTETLTQVADNAIIVTKLLMNDEFTETDLKDWIAFKFSSLFYFLKMIIKKDEV